ncbi:MAG: PRC-barrel domain-containing protein, partial [Sulfitobacter sp.]|nr:PRC-barrel domain-containing protein [Sulfitobacter sp.]
MTESDIGSVQYQQGDFYASDLIGMRIYNSGQEMEMDSTVPADSEANWEDIGEINDIIVSNDGEVRAVILGVGGFLGMGERDVAISMDDVKVVREEGNETGRFLVVNTTREALEQSPEFDRDAGTMTASTDMENNDSMTNADTASTDMENNDSMTDTDTASTDMENNDSMTDTDTASTDMENNESMTDTDTASTDMENNDSMTDTDTASTDMENNDSMTDTDTAATDMENNDSMTDTDTASNVDADVTVIESETATNDTGTTDTTLNDTSVLAQNDRADRPMLTRPTVEREGYRDMEMTEVQQLTSDMVEGSYVYGANDET